MCKRQQGSVGLDRIVTLSQQLDPENAASTWLRFCKK